MVSIVVATYNGERFIREQLDSLRRQTHRPDEVIISDDRSTDATYDRVLSYIEEYDLRSWKVTVNRENKGYCRNFLDTLITAKGDYIFLSDQDDVWLPDKVERMLKIMEENKNIWSLTTNFQCIDSNGKPLALAYHRWQRRNKLKKISLKAFMNDWGYPGMAMAIKKDCLAFIRPMLELPLISHDWLLNVICAENGRLYFYNEKLTLYRQHGHNQLGASNLHDFSQTRAMRVKEAEELYQLMELVLKKLSDIEADDKRREIAYVRGRKLLYQMRYTALKEKSFVRWLNCLRYVRYTPNIHVLLGDLLNFLSWDKKYQ